MAVLFTLVLVWSIANSGQLAPCVVAEYASCDNRRDIKTAANTATTGSQATSVQAPGTDDHQAGIDGKKEHS